MGNAVLLTGAAGFIGYHLAERLLAAGESVVGFDNLNDYYDPALKEARLAQLRRHPCFTFVRGDLADMDALTALFAREKPRAVLHLAAQAGVRYSIENPRAYIDSNITGTFNILECCRHHPVQHLIYASSSSVYGNAATPPFSVDEPAERPVSLYAATKKSNELMAYAYSRLYGIPATGLRFFTVYGPFGRPDMAYFSFTEKIVKGEPIALYNHGDMLRDFTYIDDVTRAIELMLPCPPTRDGDGSCHRLYNIGNHAPERLTDFVAILEDLLGTRALIEMRPMQPGDVYQTAADTGPLARDFGFAPSTSLRDGLKHFVDWYRAYYGV